MRNALLALPAAGDSIGFIMHDGDWALNNRLNSALIKVFRAHTLGSFIFFPFECTLLLTLYLML